MPEPTPPPEPIKQPESQPKITQKEKRDLATKKFIAERITPIVCSPEEFKIKSAAELDQMAEKIKEMYQNLTWQDAITYFPMLNSFLGYEYDDINISKTQTNQALLQTTLTSTNIPNIFNQSIYQSLKTELEQKSENQKEPIVPDSPQPIPDKYKSLSQAFDLLELGRPFHIWLEESLKSPDIETQAKTIYLVFKTENPFLFLHPEIINQTRKIFANNPEIDADQNTFEKMTFFLTEVGYSAEENGANAWGYTKKTCQDILKTLSDPNIGARFLKDLSLLAKRQSVLFPPQLFFILENIKKSQNETNTIKALEKFYQTEGIDLGIANHPILGKMSYIVSGYNRAYERQFEKQKEPNGTFLAVFSGPPDVSALEAKRGEYSEVICVDAASPNDLESLPYGRAVFIQNELLTNQSPDHIFANHLEPEEKPENTVFIQAHLPDMWQIIRDKIQKITGRLRVSDKRGSLLYLQEDDLITHITNLLTLGKERTIFDLSKGISKWMYTDLVLEKQANGSLTIKEALIGNKIYGKPKIFQAKQSVTYNDITNLGFFEIDYQEKKAMLQTAIPNLKTFFDTREIIDFFDVLKMLIQPPTSRDIFSPFGFLYDVNPSNKGIFQLINILQNILQISPTPEQKKIQEQLSTRQSESKKYTEIIEQNLTRDKLFSLIAEYFGKLKITTAKQGIFFPQTALAGFNHYYQTQDQTQELTYIQPGT
jgi:hypothetical protein